MIIAQTILLAILSSLKLNMMLITLKLNKKLTMEVIFSFESFNETTLLHKNKDLLILRIVNVIQFTLRTNTAIQTDG